jgi:hypothetical protein
VLPSQRTVQSIFYKGLMDIWNTKWSAGGVNLSPGPCVIIEAFFVGGGVTTLNRNSADINFKANWASH